MARDIRLPLAVLTLLGAALSVIAACGSDHDEPTLAGDAGSVGAASPSPGSDGSATGSREAGSPDAAPSLGDPVEIPPSCTCATPEVMHFSSPALPCGASLCVGGPDDWTEYRCFGAGDGGYVDPPVDCSDASVPSARDAS